MPLAAGTSLGPYQILSPLGAGGMGEVYRATDTRLKRQVAIKILPAALATDPERLARFQREAEVLAALNHPHIAAIYGLEDADGMKALVMELVDGLTLADHIAQGPIPIATALPIAAQIAQALEAAHEQGIIHRDLKPANVKVREDGTVKVLDFGLAKLTETDAAGRGRDGSDSPTMTSPAQMTGMGAILGTAAYMSPEQARGRAVNKRTDIWAFGALLYEMLTGRRAFQGEGIADTIAAVLTSTPDWNALPADTPAPVITLIQQCLEKDRNVRIGDLAVARFLLSGRGPSVILSPGMATVTGHPGHPPPKAAPAASTAPPTRAWSFLWTALVLVAVVSLGGLLLGAFTVWSFYRQPDPSDGAQVARLQMSVQPADQLVGSMATARPSRIAIAISPDGRQVVFNGLHNGAAQLYLRPLERAEATPIPGTEAATGPFFSPDGAWIGFWTDDKLKKVPTAGGPPATICDVPAGRGLGASWTTDGAIVFANDAGISKVSAAGGTPTVIVTRESAKGAHLMLPAALPGGKAILFTQLQNDAWKTAAIVLQPLEGSERRVLLQGGADARYVDTGHLLYMEMGTLMAVPFDLKSQQVTGTPTALIEGVMQGVNAANSDDETGAGQFVVSASGTLVYLSGGPFSLIQDAFTWVDRAGAAQPITAMPAGAYSGPRLSPDGQRIVVGVRRTNPRGSDIWVYDVNRGAPTRLTFGDSDSGLPLWSPDGKRVAFASSTNEADGIYVTSADGSGKPERLGEGGLLCSWVAATNAISYLRRTSSGAHGIWVLPMDGDRKPRLFLESRFELNFPTFSPDGHWLAYVSNESGAPELYVQPYPGPGEKIRISTAGAFEPLWAPNGRELLYRAQTRNGLGFVSAAIRSFQPFQIESPKPLFEAKGDVYDSTVPERAWDISGNGQRFLLLRRMDSADKAVTSLHVVLNWSEELKRLVRAK